MRYALDTSQRPDDQACISRVHFFRQYRWNTVAITFVLRPWLLLLLRSASCPPSNLSWKLTQSVSLHPVRPRWKEWNGSRYSNLDRATSVYQQKRFIAIAEEYPDETIVLWSLQCGINLKGQRNLRVIQFFRAHINRTRTLTNLYPIFSEAGICEYINVAFIVSHGARWFWLLCNNFPAKIQHSFQITTKNGRKVYVKHKSGSAMEVRIRYEGGGYREGQVLFAIQRSAIAYNGFCHYVKFKIHSAGGRLLFPMILPRVYLQTFGACIKGYPKAWTLGRGHYLWHLPFTFDLQVFRIDVLVLFEPCYSTPGVFWIWSS